MPVLSHKVSVTSDLTLQWVVLTGSPMLDATTTVTAEASSMLKPLWKSSEFTESAGAQRVTESGAGLALIRPISGPDPG